MKVTIKQIAPVYQAINGAKMGKMETGDQIKFVKIARKLKEIITPYEDFVKDAQEKMKGEQHEEMVSKAKKWQEEGDKCTLSDAEKIEVNKYFAEYQKSCNECVKEEAEKEHEVDFEKLSEDAFGKLMGSNDWSVDTVMAIQDIVA